MANQQTEVLRALSTKEQGVGPALLAPELRTSEANVRSYLNRLKKKGYADGGGSSWFITDAGRKALESGEDIPTSVEDVGEDELSKFTYYGQLAGVEPNLITAAVELFKNTDMRSMDEVDRVLAEINVPLTHRPRWRSLYLGYLRNTTPPEKRDEFYPLPKPVSRSEETTVAGERPRADVPDYIVEGTEIHHVCPGMGEFTFQQALQVVMAKRGTGGRTDTGGGLGEALTAFAQALNSVKPDQPITVKDLMDFAATIKGSGGEGNPPQEGYFDDEGYHLLQPGQKVIILKKEAPPSITKTVVVKQGPQGVTTEEVPPGQPIIIQTSPLGAQNNPFPMTPFPAFTADGQPAVDKDGRPVYVNIEPQLRWMGFQAEQRREQERHQMLMGLGQTVRENIPAGIQAIVSAAQEARAERQAGGTGAKAPPPEPIYECGNCHTQFKVPAGQEWTQLECPGCKHTWTKEEVQKV